MPSPRPLRIGTRGSKLARWQSDWVEGQLRAANIEVEVIEISTRGDLQPHGPIADIGVPGAFTKEIQAAVLSGEVDLAVHSLKDLPTQPVDGLVLAAVTRRENPADALISAKARSLAELPQGARVGTSSLRRRTQLLHLRPDLDVQAIRGNVDTRLRKLDAGDFDAIVLAAAGLIRLGCDGRITELLDPPRMLPAPGQGALGIECRADDGANIAILRGLDNAESRLAVTAERAALAALHGGCSAPIGTWARLTGATLALDALVVAVDGRQVLRAAGAVEISAVGDPVSLTAAAELGRSVASELHRQGAAALIAESRSM